MAVAPDAEAGLTRAGHNSVLEASPETMQQIIGAHDKYGPEPGNYQEMSWVTECRDKQS